MIKIISGPAGAGKTEEAIRIIADRGQKFLYVSPSIDMCNAFAQRLSSKSIKSKVINSETSKRTTYEIVDCINSDSVSSGLVITENSYRRIAGKLKLDDYLLVIDEFPSIFESVSLPFDEASDIEKYFVQNDSKELILKDEYKEKDRYFTFPNREVSEVLSMLQSGTCRAFASSLTERNVDGAKQTRLGVEVLLTPQYFGNNTLLMGANYKSRFAYKYLNKLGLIDSVVELKAPVDNHTSNKIVFITTTPHNTSIRMKTERQDDWNRIVSPLHNFFKDREALLLKNKRDMFPYEDGKYKDLSHNCHGIDDLKHYRNILITSDVNPSPTFVKMASEILGFSEQDILEERQLELDYQSIMRTAIRQRTLLHKTVFIGMPTHARALRQIKNFFPNARHIKADDVSKVNKTGRPKLEKISKSESNKFSRMKKLSKTHPEYYPDNIKYALLNMSIREVIKQSWWTQYNYSGKLI